jgi:hypothetical protein
MRGFWQEDSDDDDQFAETVSRSVDAMSSRRTLLRFIYILGTINLLIWASVLIVPAAVRDGFDTVWNMNQKISMIVLALVFGVGMWLTYALLRLKFPDIEDQRLDDGVMASFAYQSLSIKRFKVWSISAVGGILNVVLLILAGSIL